MVVDQLTDAGGREAYRLLRQYDAPELVKSASRPDNRPDERASLPWTAFADPIERFFPCHTAGDVVLSTLYFCNQKASIKEATAQSIEQRLLQSADFFGVRKEVDEVREKVAAASRHELEDLPDDQFAYVMNYQNGVKARHLPMRNEAELRKAAEYLEINRQLFTYEDRQKVAARILKRAEALNPSALNGQQKALEKQAAQGTGSAEQIVGMLIKRAQAVRSQHQDCEPLLQLALAATENPSLFRQPEMRRKVAALIEEIDQAHGFDKEASYFGRPEDLFSVTHNDLQDHLDEVVELTSGTIYKTAELRRVPLPVLADLLGPLFVESVTAGGLLYDLDKMAAALPRLLPGHARLLDRAAKDAGVQPLKVGSGERLDIEALARLHVQ